MSITPTTPAAKPTVTLKRSTVLIGAGAIVLLGLVVGTGLGASAGSGDDSAAQPAPTVTVTAEPEAGPPPASIESCQQAAIEMRSILEVTVNDALIPYGDVTVNLIEMLQYSDYSQVDATSVMIENVTAVVEAQTARVNAITPTYEECVNP